jgi:TctA family transporter
MSSMIKADGDLMGFFSRPIAATLGILFILLWLVPLVGTLRRRRAHVAAE